MTDLREAQTGEALGPFRARPKYVIVEKHLVVEGKQQAVIDYYKEMKARLSTKMIGESLEVHCSNEFNRVRASMYPYAYFDKAWGAVLGNLKKRHETGPVDWSLWMEMLKKMHAAKPAAK